MFWRVAAMTAILLAWTGAALAEEALGEPSPSKPQIHESASALPSPAKAESAKPKKELTREERAKRERLWNDIMTIAHKNDADPATLRSFLERFLAFYPQAENPHRALALHLIAQLDQQRPVADLSFRAPKPPPEPPEPLSPDGVDVLSLRLLFGMGVGAEAGLIGMRKSLFVADFLQAAFYFPAVNFNLGSIYGVRVPLDPAGRDEFRFQAGLSWFYVADISFFPENKVDYDTSESDLGVPIEISYVHRFYQHLALQVGVKAVIGTMHLTRRSVAFGFVGLRF